MDVLLILLSVFLILTLFYLLSLRGRRDRGRFQTLDGWNYAHRGLHQDTLPENSMGAFRAALDSGYGIELDVHLTFDGELAVIHDSSLSRVAGQDKIVEEMTLREATGCTLTGSAEHIPAFYEVLGLFSGKAPMIIELKTRGNNYAALTDRVMKELENYNGPYCLESFDPRCILYLKKHYPQVIRGILSENYLSDKSSGLPWIGRFLLANLMINFLIRPDFIAYHHPHRRKLSCVLCCRLWGIRGVAWTVRTPEDHKHVIQDGWLSIFENFRP